MTPVWNKGFLPANLESKAEKKPIVVVIPVWKWEKLVAQIGTHLPVALGEMITRLLVSQDMTVYPHIQLPGELKLCMLS